jgi:hypothetical protein
MRLEDWPLPYLRVKCGKCQREGRLNMDGLLVRFGPDRDLFVVREKLTQENCQRLDKKLPCLSMLPDALLVQAILEPDETKVLKPELLPEAREWREKLNRD